MQELQTTERNLETILALERRTLTLSERELRRKRDLMERQAVAESEHDREERNVLAQRNRVQQIENDLELLPNKRALMQDY